jgi:autonomous glycyl radical cofactor GrcA
MTAALASQIGNITKALLQLGAGDYREFDLTVTPIVIELTSDRGAHVELHAVRRGTGDDYVRRVVILKDGTIEQVLASEWSGQGMTEFARVA